MNIRYFAGGCLILALTLGVAGCADSDQEELSAWMQRERKSIKPDVTPIPEPTKIEPYAYGGERFVEPFSNE